MALLYGAPQMTSEFKVLNDFVGCGNPSGKYWFIGLEEAGEWGSNTIRQDIERYRERILPVDPGAIKSEAQKKGKGHTKIYDIMSKIVLAIDARETNYLQYRDSELLWASGETFQANLFPLGKKSREDWPESYEHLFGFKSKNQYEDYVRHSPRFAMLFKEWKAYAPHITICFGIEGWSDFKTMLNLTNDTDYVKGDWYQIYRSKIILCPFLDYRHMSTDRITAIAQHARTLLDAHP